MILKSKDKFHQYKSPILINNIDSNQIVVYNKFSFRKKDFKSSIGYKDGKKVTSYIYYFLKWVHREEFWWN